MVTLLLVHIVISWVTAEACDGYVLHVRKLGNCGNEDILKFQDANVTLTDDCFFHPSGCIIIEKEITAATAKYTFVKNMAPIAGTRNVCMDFDSISPAALPVMELFALPTSCPIKAGKVCNDKNNRVDIKKYRSKLPLLLGDIRATVRMDTNAGQTCLEFQGILTKKIMPKIPLIGTENIGRCGVACGNTAAFWFRWYIVSKPVLRGGAKFSGRW